MTTLKWLSYNLAVGSGFNEPSTMLRVQYLCWKYFERISGKKNIIWKRIELQINNDLTSTRQDYKVLLPSKNEQSLIACLFALINPESYFRGQLRSLNWFYVCSVCQASLYFVIVCLDGFYGVLKRPLCLSVELWELSLQSEWLWDS